ncbi:MAG: helix-turn-helix domain-containing protein [Promethearchaeota archaeon]
MRVLSDPELTLAELTRLYELRDNHPRKSVRRRAQVILLAHKRFQGKAIARILDMDTSSISLILKRWE